MRAQEGQGFWGKRRTAGQAAVAAPRRFRPRFLHCRTAQLRAPAGAKRKAEARSGGGAVRAGARAAPRRRRWFSVLRASAGASQARVRVPDGARGARERQRAAGGAQRGAASRPHAHPEWRGLVEQPLSSCCAAVTRPRAASARPRRARAYCTRQWCVRCTAFEESARRRSLRVAGAMPSARRASLLDSRWQPMWPTMMVKMGRRSSPSSSGMIFSGLREDCGPRWLGCWACGVVSVVSSLSVLLLLSSSSSEEEPSASLSSCSSGCTAGGAAAGAVAGELRRPLAYQVRGGVANF